MSTLNGYGPWARWMLGGLITALWGLVIMAILMLSNNVISNDQLSRERDDKIMETVSKNQMSIAELRSMRDDVSDIKRILIRGLTDKFRTKDE